MALQLHLLLLLFINIITALPCSFKDRSGEIHDLSPMTLQKYPPIHPHCLPLTVFKSGAYNYSVGSSTYYVNVCDNVHVGDLCSPSLACVVRPSGGTFLALFQNSMAYSSMYLTSPHYSSLHLLRYTPSPHFDPLYPPHPTSSFLVQYYNNDIIDSVVTISYNFGSTCGVNGYSVNLEISCGTSQGEITNLIISDCLCMYLPLSHLLFPLLHPPLLAPLPHPLRYPKLTATQIRST